MLQKNATYQGGYNKLKKFIEKTIRIPSQAIVNNIQGVVYVTFMINEDGSISDIEVAKSVHELLDEEAVRIVKQMPGWLPAMMNNTPVKSKYTLPFSFIYTIDD